MEYTDLTPGCTFIFEGTPYIVISSEFHRMQMRKAVMRTTLRNLITGQLIQKTFTAADKFEPADVTKCVAKYLYSDADYCYFMDNVSLEQYHINKESLGEKIKYLIDDMDVTLVLFQQKPVQVEFPKHINIKVIESPIAIKGDSVTSTFKTVTCENGIKVSCPLFIKEGDIIKIDTETGEYIERVRG
ncbi:MAG: elongation factor P [Candidatus Omnitrophica bacterium]|nr:elongation factor P [Candidatus Omnitrophota bacterium]